MNTTYAIKTADKVTAAIQKGFKKKAIAEHIGITRQKLDSRLKDNAFLDSEIFALKRIGII